MRTVLSVCLGFLSIAALAAEPVPPPQPDAATIMARVAENQDRSVAERARYVYIQHARVISRKGKTVRCEETTDSRVVPSATGSKQEIVKLDGRMLVKGRYVVYTHLPSPRDAAKDAAGEATAGKDANNSANKDESKDKSKAVDKSTGKADDDVLRIELDNDDTMDRDLVENMRQNLTESKSKDGIGAGLFPLTSKIQADYDFHLVGREPLNGREVYHLTFEPKDMSDFGWKGDAYIDTTAYEPVVVRTKMARNIPFAVRTLLGTSLPGLGFSVVYAEQPGGVWFPVSFGTEFKMRILFFFHREVVIGVENKAFEQTHGDATIVGVSPQS